jgi:LmbE family N-acetylglucosaminyl deacetylase
MTDRRLTLMAVHAHPDDEATGTGGILARYAAEGIQTVLVTCTDGRCGDAPGGIKPGQPGHDPDAVVALRERELIASCQVLQVSHLELLGYHDSGMMGWPNNQEPGAFWNTPVEVAAARLADLMRHYQPDVVVTYDPYGFYGHPDHIQAHRVTMAAVDLVAAGGEGGPAKVYWTTAPRSRMEEFGNIMREYGSDWDEPASVEAQPAGTDGAAADEAAAGEAAAEPREAQPEIGLPDEEITSWVDTTAFGSQKFDALAAHASQGDNIIFLRMGRERFTELMGMEVFVRIRDRTDAALPEDDLFAGLR